MGYARFSTAHGRGPGSGVARLKAIIKELHGGVGQVLEENPVGWKASLLCHATTMSCRFVASTGAL